MRSLLAAALIPLSLIGCSSAPTAGLDDPCAQMELFASTKSAEPQIIIDKVNECVLQPGVSQDLLYKALYIRATQYVDLENYSAAAEDYQRAMPLKPPKTAWDLIGPAIAYREIGKNDEALALLKRIPEENLGIKGKGSGPGMPYYYHLGWTLQKMRRNDEALSAFSQGIPYQPDFAGVYWRRGLTYEALGNKEAAKSDFSTTARLLEKYAAQHKNQSWNEADKKRAGKFRLEYEAKFKEYGISVTSLPDKKIP